MYKIDSHIKAPRIRKPKKDRIPDTVKRAFEAYSQAYKKVFGILPNSFRYDKVAQFIYIGNSAGVTAARLRELTRQLNARAG